MWFTHKDGTLLCSSYRWDAPDGFVGTRAISLKDLTRVAAELAAIDDALMEVEAVLPHSRAKWNRRVARAKSSPSKGSAKKSRPTP
jgi:hypothetical protein